MLLTFSGIVSTFALISLIYNGAGQNIIVLFFVFLQPLLILYFVYWRPRRQFASLDFVIKCFAVGFWITTIQSVVFEFVLQMTIIILLGPLMGSLSDVGMGTEMINNSFNNSIDNKVMINESGITSMIRNVILDGVQKIIFLNKSLFGSFEGRNLSFSSSPSPGITILSRSLGSALDWFHTATTSATVTDTVSGSVSASVMTATRAIFITAVSAADTTPLADDYVGFTPDLSSIARQVAKDHILAVFFAQFLMAFVVAAGVEETMKHFIVRCCPFPTPLKNPQTILGKRTFMFLFLSIVFCAFFFYSSLLLNCVITASSFDIIFSNIIFLISRILSICHHHFFFLSCYLLNLIFPFYLFVNFLFIY